MKFIKSNLKTIIAVLVTMVITSSVAVSAAIKISATEIGYNNTTVADQLDSIYQTMFSDNYSTTERQVGKWVDGKPLYQKTIEFGALPNNTSKLVSIDQNDIDKVYNAFGWAVGNSEARSLPYVSASSEYLISLDIQGTDIRIITKRNFSDMSAYITVQYTKKVQTQTNQ